MTFTERVAELRAALAERGSERVPTVTITCSSCGRTDTIAGPDPQHLETLFADWQMGDERPYSDYCPDCSEPSEVTPAARQRTGRNRRSGMKLIAYRVSFDDGLVETFEVRAQNLTAGRSDPLA